MLKKYYLLTKPGIIRGNVMSGAAGFIFASQGEIDLGLLIATLLGTSLVIASACVFNNYIDRDIDKKMVRTRKRATVTGEINAKQALTFASILGILGFVLLSVFTNPVTVTIGLVGILSYVIFYGHAKRKTPYGTEVGSIPGATSITAGYTAVAGSIDIAAAILFLIMVLWQMPHFYSIALYRLKDYKAAGIPVLPAVSGSQATKVRIVLYVIAFLVAEIFLVATGNAGYTFLATSVLVGTWWLWSGLKGFSALDDTKWGGKMFGTSLIALLAFCTVLSLDAWLP